jgi:hypothetical protein
MKEVLSILLLQVAGGNPMSLKVKRSDRMQTSEI